MGMYVLSQVHICTTIDHRPYYGLTVYERSAPYASTVACEATRYAAADAYRVALYDGLRLHVPQVAHSISSLLTTCKDVAVLSNQKITRRIVDIVL